MPRLDLQPLIGGLDPTAASLARELAQDIRPVDSILPDYGFTGQNDSQWLELYRSADFQRLLAEAIREWNNADSTAKRLVAKAQAALEIQIVELHSIAMNDRVPYERRLEAIKITKDMAGLSGPARIGLGEQGGGFSITINVGEKTMRADLTPQPKVIEGMVDKESDR